MVVRTRRRPGDLTLLLAVVAVTFAAWLAAPAPALAKSYEIPRVDIDATLQPDGTLVVTEDRTFSFDGSFNGVYWRLPAGDYEGRSVEPQVESVGVVSPSGQLQAFSEGYSGDTGTYELDPAGSYTEVKLYNPADDEDVTYRIVYRLPGLASAWADTGELYWKFVSDGWDETSQNVTCRIHLPVPAGQSVEPEGNVRAWGHGTLDGSVSFDSDDVVFSVPAVGGDDFAEARVTFPVSWLSVAPSSQPRLDSILSEEQRWADEANRRRETARAIVGGSEVAIVAVGAACLAVPVWALMRYRKRHRPVFQDEYFRDVPSSDHPAVLGALLNNGDATSEGFTATLMGVSDAGAVDLSYVQIPKKGLLGGSRDDYRLVKNPSRADALRDPVDRAFMRCLFDEVAPLAKGYEAPADGRVTLDFSSLKKVAKKHPDEFVRAYDAWSGAVEGACAERGFFTGESTGAGFCILTFVLGILAIIFGIGALIVFDAPPTAFLMLLVPIAGVVVSLVVAARLKAYSAEAVELRAKLEALRRWLKDFTRLGEAVPTDVVLWNRLLVMAVVLGVADEVIAQLRVAVPELLDDPGFMPTYIWWSAHGSMGSPAEAFGAAAASSYQASTAAIAASSNSSGGGGGGGFSGGGGGGFGGGGGGGAF
ncbi:DUF2207 domain-containing protein [Atopobiaceae bacterium 24-176]